MSTSNEFAAFDSFEFQSLRSFGKQLSRPPPVAGAQPQDVVATNIRLWNGVREMQEGFGPVSNFHVRRGESGEEIIKRFKKRYGAKGIKKLVLAFMGYKEAIFVAQISMIGISSVSYRSSFADIFVQRSTVNVEHQGQSTLVELTGKTYDQALTAAYHDPKLLRGFTDFTDANQRFEQHHGQGGVFERERAIVLGRALKKSYVAALVAGISGGAGGTGLAVGLVKHNATLGFLIAGGIAAVLGVMVPLLAALMK